jgi:hypothetical protein
LGSEADVIVSTSLPCRGSAFWQTALLAFRAAQFHTRGKQVRKAMDVHEHEWVTASEAWRLFVHSHPELGYRDGKWQIHNFLRLHRSALVEHDAIRKAKGRFWIAHRSRFLKVAFDACTGVYAEARKLPCQESNNTAK